MLQNRIAKLFEIVNSFSISLVLPVYYLLLFFY